MLSLYLETSVIAAYLDKGESLRRDLTIRWWEHELPHYQAYVSPLVERELERTREPYRRSYLALIKGLPRLRFWLKAISRAASFSASIWVMHCMSRWLHFTRLTIW